MTPSEQHLLKHTTNALLSCYEAMGAAVESDFKAFVVAQLTPCVATLEGLRAQARMRFQNVDSPAPTG
jgi:hypothetical protein